MEPQGLWTLTPQSTASVLPVVSRRLLPPLAISSSFQVGRKSAYLGRFLLKGSPQVPLSGLHLPLPGQTRGSHWSPLLPVWACAHGQDVCPVGTEAAPSATWQGSHFPGTVCVLDPWPEFGLFVLPPHCSPRGWLFTVDLHFSFQCGGWSSPSFQSLKIRKRRRQPQSLAPLRTWGQASSRGQQHTRPWAPWQPPQAALLAAFAFLACTESESWVKSPHLWPQAGGRIFFPIFLGAPSSPTGRG